MWETTIPNVFSNLRKRPVECRGIPYLPKNERYMGHPTLCGRGKKFHGLWKGKKGELD